MSQNVVSDQGLHCLPLILEFSWLITGSAIDLSIIKDKNGKDLDHPNSSGKQVNPFRELCIILIFPKTDFHLIQH